MAFVEMLGTMAIGMVAFVCALFFFATIGYEKKWVPAMFFIGFVAALVIGVLLFGNVGVR